jgi:fatty-acyl-CoA synthase
MRSTMQDDFPLTVSAIMRHAAALHSEVELAVFDGASVRRLTYAEVARRAHALSGALHAAGVRAGDRVGSFMWNTQPHLEAYLAVPGMGAVLHTVNIRLFPDQIRFIIDQARDEVVLVDASLWDAFAPVLEQVGCVRLVVVAGDLDVEAAAAATGVDVVGYEDFIAGADPLTLDVEDERSPALMCYTSGTTGSPKGVVYSHRSVYLHAMVNLTSAGFGIGDSDRLLQVVPMFHANGWGFPYAAWLAGASLILPDRYLQPELLTPLIATERPTVSGGVPTVWRGVFDHARAHGLDLTSLRVVSCAGSAVPESLLRDYRSLGIDLLQAWGMTETSPLAAIARPPVVDRGKDEWYWRTRTGRPVPGVEVRTVDKSGAVLPADGVSVGELEVRGPWVTGSYHGGTGAGGFHSGWLRTGDMGTVDEAGAMKITDRLKDLIKSGGEWISSTELEDHLTSHPAVLEAAVIGVPDPRWEERPLAVLHLRPGVEVSDEELREHLAGRIARWQVPDRWVRVAAIPKTGVGKLDKQSLRQSWAAGDLERTVD